MKFKYFFSGILTNFCRFFRIFPNADPIMGFALPAAKNEPWWKGALFAFVVMFTFDILTNHLGLWTLVTSLTYAAVIMLFHFFLKNKESTMRLFLGSGAVAVLIFDFITGPIMSSFMFKQPFLVTLIMQIPFTLLHIVSVSFSILIISPFLDPQLNKEMSRHVSSVKNLARNFVFYLRNA